ncbi:hypothetical protein SAMN05428971_2750 [Candidatus Pantoea varia]|uniref:Uncharacterized protein n=1 Tax=Candidatus Pantoea varia TaxID=1881036 RepID=A0A1I5E365_9GAMM|nr:hypothetical protein SAMN05428971_2750 [Pantoea varia]
MLRANSGRWRLKSTIKMRHINSHRKEILVSKNHLYADICILALSLCIHMKQLYNQ